MGFSNNVGTPLDEVTLTKNLSGNAEIKDGGISAIKMANGVLKNTILGSGTFSGTGTGNVANLTNANFSTTGDIGKGYIRIKVWLKLNTLGSPVVCLGNTNTGQQLSLGYSSTDFGYTEFIIFKSPVTSTKCNAICFGSKLNAIITSNEAVYDSAIFTLNAIEQIFINGNIANGVTYTGNWIAELINE